MASPQKEHGFTAIANELFEVFYRCKLSEYERCVVMSIWRKTYGWNKKIDWITGTQISADTGIHRTHVSRTIKKLKSCKIVTCTGNKISVNKDYNEWIVEWRLLPRGVTDVTSTGNKLLPLQVHTKAISNITKDNGGGDPPQPALKGKNKTMGWNSKSEDFEEGVVDFETGDLTDPVADKKVTDKKLNARMDELVDWLIAVQQRDPVRTSRPKQKKAIKELVKMQVTGDEAKNIIKDEMEKDYWKERKEKPDYFTVVAIIHKRGE